MKRSTFTLTLVLAANVCLFIACSRSAPTVPPAISPTAAPAATTATSQPSAQPSAAAVAATKTGWWIRINTTLTTAEVITFQIGTDKLNREEWRVWRAGEPADFDVPAKYQQAPRLYLRGSVTPIGKFGDLCMMYKERGVDHLGFDDDDSGTKSRLEFDPKCR